MIIILILTVISVAGLLHVVLNVFNRLSIFKKLWILDLRTFRWYSIAIEKSSIRATDFRKISPLGITASYKDHIAKGLTVLDPGFRNTAVRESRITYMYVYRQPVNLLICLNKTEAMGIVVLCSSANTQLVTCSSTTTTKMSRIY